MSAPRAKARAADRLSSPLASGRRLALYLTLTLSLIGVQVIALALRLRLSRTLPRVYHRLCCRILGFRVEMRGMASAVRPTLFVSNHTSYVDIIVLGSLLECAFIAKAEVARWPFFGWLAKLQRTVFVDRRGLRVAGQRDEIHRRLTHGDDMVLFPEGTSNDGLRVMPFKSALFAVAQDTVRDRPLTVQPVSIAYTRLDGMPLGRALRPHYAWYGGMTLMPHLLTMLGIGTATVTVTFHEPVEGPSFASRKALADHCWRVISGGVQAANSGRPLPAPYNPPDPAAAAAAAPAPQP